MSDPRDAEAREIVEPFLNRALVLSAPNSETAVRVLGIAAKQARVRAVAALARRDDALARAVAVVDAVMYAMRCGLLFDGAYEPPADATTQDLVRWGAIRNLHDKVAAFSRERATPAGAEPVASQGSGDEEAT